jgi:hypothetical protein
MNLYGIYGIYGIYNFAARYLQCVYIVTMISTNFLPDICESLQPSMITMTVRATAIPEAR